MDDPDETNEDGSKENRRVADLYRRERQKSEAESLGIEPIDPVAHIEWLEKNQEMLAKAARAGGATEAEVPEFIKSYRESMRDDPVGSEYDDPHAINIINRVVLNIEAICKRAAIPTREGVVFGVTPSFGAVANQSPVLTTDASIIGLSIPFFVFCAAITKAMAKTLVYTRKDALLFVDNRPTSVSAKLISEPHVVEFWTRILRDFGGNVWPPNLEEPSLNADEGTIRTDLLTGVELFSIAHEYGHHVLKHGVVTSTENSENALDQEHDADVFARIVGLLNENQHARPSPVSASGAAAVLILGALDLVRRANCVLATGSDNPPPRKSHPPFRDRIAYIAGGDHLAPEQARADLSVRRNNFCEIIEMVWAEVRPRLLSLHQQGLRPNDRRDVDLGGWLPLAN